MVPDMSMMRREVPRKSESLAVIAETLAQDAELEEPLLLPEREAMKLIDAERSVEQAKQVRRQEWDRQTEALKALKHVDEQVRITTEEEASSGMWAVAAANKEAELTGKLRTVVMRPQQTKASSIAHLDKSTQRFQTNGIASSITQMDETTQ